MKDKCELSKIILFKDMGRCDLRETLNFDHPKKKLRSISFSMKGMIA